jgi:hypothetical protein
MLTLGDLSTEWALALPITAAMLGALVAFVWNYYLRRREEHRELRAVARILDAELAHAENLIERARSSENSPPLDRMRQLGDADWREYRLLLARHLPKGDWHAVQLAYAALGHLRALADEMAARRTEPLNRDGDAMSWHFPRERDLTVVADARGVIKPYADVSREERGEILEIIRYAVAPQRRPKEQPQEPSRSSED